MKRNGMALIGALVALAVVSALMATVSVHMVLNRRMAEMRQAQLQANWLARGGVELAAAGLLIAPDYAGEKAVPIPRSQVQVTVQREEPRSGETYRVVSEARYPTDLRHPVRRVVERKLRRVVEGSQVRIEVLPSVDARP